MQVFLFILALILFIGLVLAHEWGHFIIARRNGVDVEEFGLGFPPRAAGKRLKSGMLLSLNWLPLGGFVKLRGEHDNATSPGTFGSAGLGAKTRILLAGVTMNLLVGLVLLMVLAWVGMPVLISSDTYGQGQYTVPSDTKVIRQEVEVYYVIPGSPADQAGIIATDTIKNIQAAGRTYKIETTDQLRSTTKELAGQNVSVTYVHSGQTLTKNVKLLSAKEVSNSLKTNNPKGYLGVEPNQLTIQRSTWSAPIVALGLAKQLFVLTLQGIGHALAGLGSLIAGLVSGNHQARVNGQIQAESQVGGPVAIMKILWSSGNLGINFVLAIIAILSLTLALMNVLPIPALDGGRLAMILVSRGLMKRPLSRQAEEKLVGAGFVLIMLLVILITIADVKR